jgi:hypothetical protein
MLNQLYLPVNKPIIVRLRSKDRNPQLRGPPSSA